jgi:hypothetical protein
MPVSTAKGVPVISITGQAAEHLADLLHKAHCSLRLQARKEDTPGHKRHILADDFATRGQPVRYVSERTPPG